MHSTFILCFLLVCTAVAQGREWGSLDMEVDTEDDMEDDMEAVTVEHLPGTCYLCKRILETVKMGLPDDASKNQILQKLRNVCNKLGPIKHLCKKLVSKNLNKMLDELLTDDGPRQACVNMRLCKPKVFMELV